LSLIMSKCTICGRGLSNPADPFSEDCGRDCLLCMADAGDPECVEGALKAARTAADALSASPPSETLTRIRYDDDLDRLREQRDSARDLIDIMRAQAADDLRELDAFEARATTAEAAVARLTEALLRLDEMIYQDPQVIERAGEWRDFISAALSPITPAEQEQPE
jgi:hypothetical protein